MNTLKTVIRTAIVLDSKGDEYTVSESFLPYGEDDPETVVYMIDPLDGVRNYLDVPGTGRGVTLDAALSALSDYLRFVPAPGTLFRVDDSRTVYVRVQPTSWLLSQPRTSTPERYQHTVYGVVVSCPDDPEYVGYCDEFALLPDSYGRLTEFTPASAVITS